MPRRRPHRGPSLFEELVFASDRDRIPGARPVVSFSDHDDGAFLEELFAASHDRHELSRRGILHGQWAELDLTPLGLGARHAAADEQGRRRRWGEARPILLPGVAAGLHEQHGSLTEVFELFEQLPRAGSLAAWLRSRRELLHTGTQPHSRHVRLADPERDIEKVYLSCAGPGGRELRDLWLKSAWLSTHDGDASLRMRISFGREVDDDASADGRRHQLVGGLAQALIPYAAELAQNRALEQALGTAVGQEIYYTQQIAYWNSPEGGARFHHDAFGEGADAGQLGVCFVQIAGRTAWLALSLADLAARVREFVANLERGAQSWLRDQLFPTHADFERLLERVREDRALERELALPGCGSLGKLVDRGPEFTGFLADGGHALVLEEGDALLLPNHGLAQTAMHSVFCASERPTYAVSMAVRALRPPPRAQPIEHWERELATEEG